MSGSANKSSAKISQKPTATRAVDIEDFARWAILDELPKSRVPMRSIERPAGVGNGWNSVDYCVPIDRGVVRPSLINDYGLAAFDLHDAPHADAVEFHSVVTEIDADGLFRVDIPRDVIYGLDIWAHREIGDPDGVVIALLDAAQSMASDKVLVPRHQEPVLKPHTATVTNMYRSGRANGGGDDAPSSKSPNVLWPRRGLWGLATHAAIMRGVDWHVETMRLDFARSHNGMPKWYRTVTGDVGGEIVTRVVDGFDQKRRRPFPDAYRRLELRPDPTTALGCRIEWLIWQALLGEVAMRLQGRLADHDVIVPDPVDLPWMTTKDKPRIWVQTIADESLSAALASKAKKRNRLTA